MTWDYPAYMTNLHQSWLTGVDTQITAAISANPFDNLTGYDPTSDAAIMARAVATFTKQVSEVDPSIFADYFGQAATLVDDTISPATYISARALAHAAALDNEINSKVLPRFHSGMRDINAVQTSAFVIGRAIIEIDRNDKVDKFIADMEFQADTKRSDMIQAATDEMIRIFLQNVELKRVTAALTLDYLRLKIAAHGDYKTETKAIAADHGRWPLEVYKYGSNMLAGISGGVTSSVPMDGNKTARVVMSGLSGAVAGAQIGLKVGGDSGAGYGALIGGLAGLIGGM